MTIFGVSPEELPGGSGGGLGELSRGIFAFLLMDNCRKSVGHGGDRREERAGEVGRGGEGRIRDGRPKKISGKGGWMIGVAACKMGRSFSK
jgi:hypothetical protein